MVGTGLGQTRARETREKSSGDTRLKRLGGEGGGQSVHLGVSIQKKKIHQHLGDYKPREEKLCAARTLAAEVWRPYWAGRGVEGGCWKQARQMRKRQAHGRNGTPKRLQA